MLPKRFELYPAMNREQLKNFKHVSDKTEVGFKQVKVKMDWTLLPDRKEEDQIRAQSDRTEERKQIRIVVIGYWETRTLWK